MIACIDSAFVRGEKLQLQTDEFIAVIDYVIIYRNHLVAYRRQVLIMASVLASVQTAL